MGVFCLFRFFFFLMIRRPPRSTQSRSSAASDVYKRQARDHLYAERETDRDDDQVIEQSQHRDEVRYEIYRAERVAYDSDGQYLGVPGGAGMAGGEVKCVSLRLEPGRPFFPLIAVHITRYSPTCRCQRQ